MAEDPSKYVIFKAYIHCKACARDASECLKGFPGVEDVAIDAANNKIAVKGKNVNAIKVLKRLRTKFSRNVELISPVPQPVQPKKGPPKKKEITIRTNELRLLMHCEGCAKDVERSIYKMKGVIGVEPDMEKGKVSVTGAFEESKLLNHARKHVNKYAEIVPVPTPAPEENSKAEEVEADLLYYPQTRIHHRCPCEMFNDENVDSCCVM